MLCDRNGCRVKCCQQQNMKICSVTNACWNGCLVTQMLSVTDFGTEHEDRFSCTFMLTKMSVKCCALEQNMKWRQVQSHNIYIYVCVYMLMKRLLSQMLLMKILNYEQHVKKKLCHASHVCSQTWFLSQMLSVSDPEREYQLVKKGWVPQNMYW